MGPDISNVTLSKAGTYTLTATDNTTGCYQSAATNVVVNSPSTGIDVKTACDSYTWINGVTYTSSTNTPTDTLVNAVGCDSVVTLHLTINYRDITSFTVVSCDSYTWAGETYTSSCDTTELLPTHQVATALLPYILLFILLQPLLQLPSPTIRRV